MLLEQEDDALSCSCLMRIESSPSRIRNPDLTATKRTRHHTSRSSLVGILLVLALVFAPLISAVESFQIPAAPGQQRTPEQKTHHPLTTTIMMSTTTTADAETESSSISNWRTLSKPPVVAAGATSSEDEDENPNRRILLPSGDDEDRRPLWSPAAYRDSLELHEKLMQCSDSYVNDRIRAALTCLDHALRLYGPESVLCSFNGGKDAVVILHLVRAAMAQHYHNATNSSSNNSSKPLRIVRPRVIYFDHEHEFPEILEFLHDSVREFDLDMIAFAKGTKFQDGLRVLTEHNVASSADSSSSSVVLPMAFVLGTRLTDPNAVGQQQFAPSSHYMPPFMRVNPILDWTYGHVWHVLRQFQLPYCRLYDQGYTSLGTVRDTVPCPALAVPGQSSRQQQQQPSQVLAGVHAAGLGSGAGGTAAAQGGGGEKVPQTQAAFQRPVANQRNCLDRSPLDHVGRARAAPKQDGLRG